MVAAAVVVLTAADPSAQAAELDDSALLSAAPDDCWVEAPIPADSVAEELDDLGSAQRDCSARVEAVADESWVPPGMVDPILPVEASESGGRAPPVQVPPDSVLEHSVRADSPAVQAAELLAVMKAEPDDTPVKATVRDGCSALADLVVDERVQPTTVAPNAPLAELPVATMAVQDDMPVAEWAENDCLRRVDSQAVADLR